MNCVKRDIANTNETLVISSNNNTNPLDVTKIYKLANNSQRKENKYLNAFKNSILGAEIGVKAEGFSNVLILGTLVAIGALSIMYAFWRI